jgi:phage terminase large subunit
VEITLPNGWVPRDYQLDAWRYLEAGGKSAYLIWHRRSGKDDTALHWAAVASHMRVGNYWHMLPQATQARAAVWEAINPHTGKRRIDEAFPKELRETTRENEMFIRFKNGSAWQLVGSDNYDRLVGSPPIGVVFSEWALAKPQAWAYLRPIMAENGGWAAFITTPRGRNHAAKMYEALKGDERAFVQKLTAEQTGVFTKEQLAAERKAYIGEYGATQGQALFDQEYMCSFDAALMGAIYARDIQAAQDRGQLTAVPYEPSRLVSTAWDIGWGDSTAIWFYQLIGAEVRVIDFYETRGEPVTHYLSVLKARGYQYDTLWLPHDADNGQLATGKSIAELVRENGFKVQIAPKLSIEEGINAGRLLLGKAVFDEKRCGPGIEALRNYRWDYNARLDELKPEPLHDWSSHASDAFRYLAVSLRTEKPKVKVIKYSNAGII